MALRAPLVSISSWSREQVHGGFGGAIGGTAIYRFRGVTGRHRKWSLVLKILYQRPAETETSPYYWKREYEVYNSGLLDSLPANTFATPEIFWLEDFGKCCWIWMEDLRDAKVQWSLADYDSVALRLGRFNGAYLSGYELPDYSWLASDWHSAIVPALSDCFDALDRLLQHPLARRTLPIESRQEIESIWQNRSDYIDALSLLPTTFCHIDAFRRNILHRNGDMILIDWAMAGHGRLGEELVCMIALALYYHGFSRSNAVELEEAVLRSYIRGLRQSGWNGDPMPVRLGYSCAMVLRGLAGVKQDINLLLDESKHHELMENHGCDSITQVADFFAAVRRFRLLQKAEDARKLFKR